MDEYPQLLRAGPPPQRQPPLKRPEELAASSGPHKALCTACALLPSSHSASIPAPRLGRSGAWTMSQIPQGRRCPLSSSRALPPQPHLNAHWSGLVLAGTPSSLGGGKSTARPQAEGSGAPTLLSHLPGRGSSAGVASGGGGGRWESAPPPCLSAAVFSLWDASCPFPWGRSPVPSEGGGRIPPHSASRSSEGRGGLLGEAACLVLLEVMFSPPNP